MFKYLPRSWRDEFANVRIKRVHGGMSGALVYRVGADRYLKIGRDDAAAPLREEIVRTLWLHDRGIRAPEIVRAQMNGETVAMLARAMPGVSAEHSPLSPAVLIAALGRALAGLHALPAMSCPYDETVAKRLARARYTIESGEADGAHFASRNRGVEPIALYRRLATSIPAEDLVVVHGDATLSNMIIDDDGSVGFIDCGHCGRADRYLDLAVVADDICNTFGEAWVRPFADAYGEQTWQTAKAQFYSDLYELF